VKEEVKILALDRYEVGLIVNALNEMRNNRIALNEDTTFIDEVLIRVIDTPFKKRHLRVLECR
jgi:hypothetical protein